jgi:hypothetical protein
MRIWRSLLVTFVSCSTGVAALFAQELSHSPEAQSVLADTLTRRNSLSILFDRNLNTYNWVGRLFLDTAIAGNRVAVAEQYSSNIIAVDQSTPGTSQKLRSDQQTLSLLLARHAFTSLDVQTQWYSLVSTDNRGVGLGNASSHSLLGGIAYTPLQWLTITPMAGYRWDAQADIRDQGMVIDLAGRVWPIDLDGYSVAAGGQFHRDMLDPRLLESNGAHAGAQKIFGGRSRDSLEVGIGRTRREFYTIADSTIESRIDNTLQISNLLDYEIGRNVLTTVFVSVASRGLDKTTRPFGVLPPQQPQFPTRIEEFHLDAFVQGMYHSDDGRTSGSLRLFHSERDETHNAIPIENAPPALFNERNRQEQSKDNLAKRTALSGTIEVPFSFSDRLAIAALASILRYDTPSDLNLEDRDELLVAVSLGTSHRISRALQLGVGLDGSMSHLVYLLKERSANNAVNRVLRLSPRVFWRPTEGLFSLNVFEVLANYTVYDYEGELSRLKSYSYRQFGWLDSSTAVLTNRIALDFFVYLKLYERGQLKWDEFTERTESSLVDKTFALQVRFTPDFRSTFAVGLRYFSETRYLYGPVGKTLSSFLSSFGPTCAITYGIGSLSTVGLRGWYERRKQPDGSSRQFGSMTMNVSISL